jgi:hypothetical protein
MQLTPVQSSNIKAVGYDPASRALQVQFNSGATHQYEDVPPEKHAAMTAPDSSVGKYFHANIKSAHTSSKVDG